MEGRRLDFCIDFERGARFACLHAQVPRVVCEACEAKHVEVPWARRGSGPGDRAGRKTVAGYLATALEPGWEPGRTPPTTEALAGELYRRHRFAGSRALIETVRVPTGSSTTGIAMTGDGTLVAPALTNPEVPFLV